MEAAETIQDLPATTKTAPNVGLLIISLAAITALADFCFWRDKPRLSVGLFALGAAGMILLNRPRMQWTRRAILLVALICGAAVESAIDLCFSNGLVLLALIVALAGETYYGPLRSGWSRWSETVWTMVKTPARWIWLGIELRNLALENTSTRRGTVRKVARIAWIVVPGLAVTLVFAVILGNGNALFAKFANDWTMVIRNWILSLDLNFWRCFLWGFVAWISLPLLWPSPPPKSERIWTKELPRLPEFTTAATAKLQSAVMLGLLNALFCFVNTIDVVYLWARQALPAGVGFSAFVHEGVASLIMAALFSAVLLVGVLQQERSVSTWMPIKLLGLLWIAQNLMLLAGVALRVKLYLDAFDLTVLRVNLLFFLLLIATGFVLLAIHVWRQRTLGWLLYANMLATFSLFYTVQFLDTRSFVARYNVSLWQDSHESRALDFAYLESLGPPAFDAIQRVAQSNHPQVSVDATQYLKTQRNEARNQLAQTPWPSWQLRDVHCQRKLLTKSEP